MKEMLITHATSPEMVSFKAPRRLTVDRQNTYAESTRSMQDIADTAEIKKHSETSEESERRIQQERKSQILDGYQKNLVEAKFAIEEKKSLPLNELEKAYYQLTNSISEVKQVLPKKWAKKILKEGVKAQRKLRNELLIRRSEEKIKQAEKNGKKPKEQNLTDTERFLKKWKRRFTKLEWKDEEVQEKTKALAKAGQVPGDGDDEEVKENAKLEKEERIEKAEEILKEYLGKDVDLHSNDEKSKKKRDAIEKAHKWGDGSHDEGTEGKEEGTKAGVYNYKVKQLLEKSKILEEAGFDEEQREALIAAGIVGSESGGLSERDPTHRPDDDSDSPRDPYWTSPIIENPRVPRSPRQRAEVGEDIYEEGEYDPEEEYRMEQRRRVESGPGRVRGRKLNLGDFKTFEDVTSGDEFQDSLEYTIGTSVDDDLNIGKDLEPGHRERGYGGELRITSVEALAEEIMRYEGRERWGTAGVRGLEEDGEFPLLKAVMDNGVQRVETKLEKVKVIENGKTVTKEVPVEKKVFELNEANFLRWVRERMMYWHGESPDDEYDFGQQVEIKREFSPINLKAMVNNANRYFKSEAHKGKVYTELAEQIKRESWLFAASRSTDIQYRAVMGSDEDLPKAITKLFYGNTFTKSVWGGKSGLYWMMTMPENFVEPPKEGEARADEKSDMKLGQALNHAYQVYYNIADREALERLLGKDAPLLSAQRVRETLDVLRVEDRIPDDQRDTYVNPDELAKIDKPEELIKYINIFNQQGKSTRIVRAVRRLVQESIAEKFNLYLYDENGNRKKEEVVDIDFSTGKVKRDADGKVITREIDLMDKTHVSYADTFALSMARWSGAASRNDVNAQGYDAWTRVQVTDEYRKKQVRKERGGAMGNPYTVNALKQLGTDLFSGIQVQNMERYENEEGKKLLKIKSTLDVLNEMVNSDSDEKYSETASQLVFGDNTMRDFAQNHIGRSFTIFQQVMGTEEIAFDKFTHYDYLRGVTFDRQAFEEAVKEKFFKPMRYAYSTYSQIDYGKVVRTDVGDGNFEEKRLAEAMFGREILDGLGHKYIHHGKEHISMKDENWSEKINWDELSTRQGRIDLWRQVALFRLGAQLYAHKDRHSTDPHYNWWYYNEILESLESIPSDVVGDETSMRDSKAVGQFFSHHDMEWLRKFSHTEAWRLYSRAIASDLFKGSASGFKDALKLFFKGITTGK